MTPQSADGRMRAALGVLFPAPPPREPGHADAPGAGRRRAASIVIQVAAVCAGAIVLLLRIPGIPAWDSVYAEDKGVFLLDALAHPWHLLVPYGGYEELTPRIIGQLVSYLPLRDVAVAFALTGAVIAALCALFVFHTMEGWIRSPWLRALAGAALILLPMATIEIADNTVNSPWYTLAALPFGLLWRPKGGAGMAAAALVAFAATSSEILAIVCAPLVLIRLIALPRWREHAVTAGWLAGLLVQVPVVLESYAQHTQRLASLGTPGYAVAYYFHSVTLRALGWRLSVRLAGIAGLNGATLIVGAILAIGLCWALVTGTRQVRVFAAVALITGFAETVFAATVAPNLFVSADVDLGSRYADMPIMLITATGVVAVDSYVRRQSERRQSERRQSESRQSGSQPPGGRHLTPQALIAIAILACVLAIGWIPDYRWGITSKTWGYWKPQAEQMLTACEHSTSGTITVPAWRGSKATIPCSRLRW